MSDQLSLFAGDPAGPNVDDLQGLLVGPGQAVRRQGTARLSVIVTAQWRADALLAEFAARGLPGDQSVADGDGIVVRTEFSGELAALADRWFRGAVKSPPNGCALGAGSLRLWAIAAGANSVPASRKSAASAERSGSDRPAASGGRSGSDRHGDETASAGGPDPNGETAPSGGPDPNGEETASSGVPNRNRHEDAGLGSPADSPAVPAGFLLRLGHTDRPAYPTIGRLLDQVGIPGTYVGVRAGGPAYRITGRRRLAVLRAYVGEPPLGADSWPAPAQ